MIRDLLEELQEHVGLAQAALVREEFASRDSFFHPVDGRVPVAEVEEFLSLLQGNLRNMLRDL